MAVKKNKPQGREQMRYRPFLVMSPFQYNRMASIVLICPITNQKKGLNFEHNFIKMQIDLYKRN
ncbi:type II toxin-antitoxin system PemK/MazF family toxin [Nostoc sp.]|uniref:type II toxin-antitoxin system PemK/MazF family toxin n=1 Tax=Nostoc sp. TaxID=1180 RepID=UPI002FF76ADF